MFNPNVLEPLALITLGRSAGFSLDEIALMFAPDGRPRIDRRMFAAKAEELDRTIRKLNPDASRSEACRCLSCAEPRGMSHLPAHPTGRIWSNWSAKNRKIPLSFGLASCDHDHRRGCYNGSRTGSVSSGSRYIP